MKNRIRGLLWVALLLIATACNSFEPAPYAYDEEGAPAGDATLRAGQDAATAPPLVPVDQSNPLAYKIGIVTATGTQGWEELRAAQQMQEKYGDMIVIAMYPDDFASRPQGVVDTVVALASDPAMQAIVFVPAVTGACEAMDLVRETKPDMLFIAGAPSEDPLMIATSADLVLQADELAMGYSVPVQAKALGAKTFVQYTFPRHMSYSVLAMRTKIFEEQCETLGIEFVQAIVPDPTAQFGVEKAQEAILQDVPRMIEKYGKDTNFFSTNCAMQEPLIRQTLKYDGIFAQQCCPSPFHAYPEALGIEVAGHEGDVPYILDQIKLKVAQGGGSGRFSTWAIPVSTLMVEAGVNYAKLFAEGKLHKPCDNEKVLEVLSATAAKSGKACTVTNYEQDGESIDNFFMILCDFVTF